MKINETAIQEFIDVRLSAAKVLVVGDIMLDKYYFGEVRKISPEAPVPITRITETKEVPGGAANVAHNLAALGCRTFLAGAVGIDEDAGIVRSLLAENGIASAGLIARQAPTTVKLRVVGGHQQMLRLDFEDTASIDGTVESRLLSYISAVLRTQQPGSVIISDYAKGVCTPTLCQGIIACCTAAGVPVMVDPKKADWDKYSHAAYITPNLKEINDISRKPLANDDDDVRLAAQRVRRKYKISNVIVTRSERGLSFIGPRLVRHLPTVAQEVFDISGAGDTVIAVLAASIAGGLNPIAAALLANVAAGVAVGRVGTYAISQAELAEAWTQFSQSFSRMLL